MPTIIPSRRRGKLAAAAQTARRLTLIRAAAALLETRLWSRLPGRRKPRAVTPGRAAVAGGAVAAAAAAVAAGRRALGGGGAPAAPPSPAPAPPPPAPANYDAKRPPISTATPVPAAAASDAAHIGGAPTDYAGAEPGEPAGAAEQPVAEAGGGVSEGQEQAEGGLVDNVTAEIGPGGAAADDARRLDEAIDQASDPAGGEAPSPAEPGEEGDPPRPIT